MSNPFHASGESRVGRSRLDHLSLPAGRDVCAASHSAAGGASSAALAASAATPASNQPSRSRPLLCHLPQRTRQDGEPDAGPGRRRRPWREPGGLGKGDAQGAHRHHAAAEHAAAGAGRSPRAADAGWKRRSMRRRPAKPNPGRTETLRRLNRTEYRNAVRDLLALDIDANVAPAGRRERPRVRQRHGRRLAADAARSLHLGGAESQPPRDWQHADVDAGRHHPAAGRSNAGNARRRSSAWHPRRRVDPVHVRPGRRVRDSGVACARLEREHRGIARTEPFARDDCARRPRAGEVLHHSEARRRRHHAGQGSESARHRQRRPARHRRDVH